VREHPDETVELGEPIDWRSNMNKYALLAQRHWETYRPIELAQMRDRDRFFAELGEQISYQVAERSRQLEGGVQPGEAYVAKVNRLRAARLTAEEQVLSETLPAAEGDQPQGRSSASMSL
jgi:hypothetical protein